MSVRSMEERLATIEQGNNSNSNSKGASNNKLKKILDSFIDRLHKKLIDVESESKVQSNSSDQSEQ
jgi:hypothetical protein